MSRYDETKALLFVIGALLVIAGLFVVCVTVASRIGVTL